MTSYLWFLLGLTLAAGISFVDDVRSLQTRVSAHTSTSLSTGFNELKMSHVTVSLLYTSLQLVVSLGFIYLCPPLAAHLAMPLVLVHWVYLVAALALLAIAYVAFKKKYYWMHEEYLASLKK